MSKKHKKQKSKKTKPSPYEKVAQVCASILAQEASVNSRADHAEDIGDDVAKTAQLEIEPVTPTPNPAVTLHDEVRDLEPGLPRSQALYEAFRELYKLARSCTLKEYCYAEDKTKMCALRDKIERLRQNGSEFDTLVVEATARVVSEMKCINFWRDAPFTRYQVLDVLEQHRQQVATAAATLLACEA